ALGSLAPAVAAELAAREVERAVRLAGQQAAVAVEVLAAVRAEVRAVALLDALAESVAAARKPTVATAVAEDEIAVIALLVRLLDPVAAELGPTCVVAAVAVSRVPVVALLARLDDAIAAARRSTVRVAAVAIDPVAVVTDLAVADVEHAVAAPAPCGHEVGPDACLRNDEAPVKDVTGVADPSLQTRLAVEVAAAPPRRRHVRPPRRAMQLRRPRAAEPFERQRGRCDDDGTCTGRGPATDDVFLLHEEAPAGAGTRRRGCSEKRHGPPDQVTRRPCHGRVAYRARRLAVNVGGVVHRRRIAAA